MNLLRSIFTRREPTALLAKERLHLVLAHERAQRNSPDFLPALQKDLLAVVAKYIEARDDMIQVKIDRSGTTSTLEINIEFPGAPALRGTAG